MTTKQHILSLLSPNKVLHKGVIEDMVRATSDKPMGDTTARRLRELVAEGKIVKLTDDNSNTMYKLKPSDWATGSKDVSEVKASMFPEMPIARSVDWRRH